ncbi:hypothetical protein SLEP1_g51790 [Rubroshorea leprosula]|uniref:Uncharacterized protein n=1 Tax=Rubroshorea leprosula TaxID=152421 RepID=A0AAV5M6W3_9ROSI|nr:hypothetical protein SLEP1_g51790 [Rubroshorea leprosula]
MSEENAATDPEKSTMDERVNKLEATMQTMAAILQTINLTLSTLTTGSVPSPASLIPTIPVPPVPTITPGNYAKDPMVTQLQFPPIYENHPLVGKSSSHALQISSLPFEASYPPFEINNLTLPTTTPLILNIPPLMGQVPAIQPNPSVEMLRPTVEDGKSRKVDHKLQQLEEALEAMQGPQAYGSIDLNNLYYYLGIQTNFKFKQPDFDKYDGSGCPYAHLQMTSRAWLAPYVGYTFAQLVTASEQIEEGLKAGKKEDEEALNHIFTSHAKPIYSMANVPYNQQPQLQHTPIFKSTTYPQRRPNFDAHASLVAVGLTQTVQANLVQPSYSYGYDPQAKCEYHNVTGHGTEYCTALKHKIQDLIDEGKLQLDETKSAPSITQNPLPPHGEPTMNMSTLDEVDRPILENVGSWSLDELFAILIEYDLIQPIASMSSNVSPVTIDDALVCLYHSNMKGHTLQNCGDFQRKIIKLQRMGSLKFMSTPELEKFIAPVTKEYFTKERPYILQDTKRAPAISQNFQQPYVLQTSLSESFMGKTSSVANSHFPYSLKVMPQRPIILSSTTNDVSNMTHSGRCYVIPQVEELRKAALKSKDIRIEEMPEESPKKLVLENEVVEFLNILRKSEYSIIEQLNKTPAKIFVLELLLSSEIHLAALLKVLKEAHVPKNIDTQNGYSHLCSVQDVNVPHVLIDNGSALNAIPMTVLKQLKVDESHINQCNTVVCAFDGTKRNVVGKIELLVEIGPVTFDVDFFVMDISPIFNMLLGRPWIHVARVVPSTLHQKVKYIVNGVLVKCAATSYIHPKLRGKQVKMAKPARVAAKIMLSCHYQLGEGLGLNGQGILEPIKVIQAWGTFGLGYKPKKEDWQRMHAIKAEKHLVRLQGMNQYPEGTIFTDRLLEIGECSKQAKFEEVVVEDITDEVCFDDEENSFGFNNLIGPANMTDPKERWRRMLAERHLRRSTPTSILPADDESLNNDAISDFIYEIDDQTYSEEDNENFDPSHELTQMLREEKPKLQPNQETETINLGTEDDRKEIKINAHLSIEDRKELIEILAKFQDVFAWSYKDMPGLDPDIAVHSIPLYSEAKPVKQKLRRIKLKVLLKVKEEVQKLLDVNFIEVAMYLGWVANIVPVMKKDGRVRVCMDYRNLNKAIPKDDFPLPHIQILLDNATKNARFSFVDSYSRYNQIKMEEDKLKTTFITQWGTFCYKVMPFGLKNAGATYQRSVITLLHDFVHTIVELYVDDMVIMSKEEVLHTKNLKKVFKRLRKYQLRLNPAKCTFDVDSGKLLGFIISPWHMLLSEFDMVYTTQKAIKGQAIADHLTEHAAEDFEPIDWDFLDEDILVVKVEFDLDNWKLFFDGAINRLGCGLGVVLVSPKGDHFLIAKKLDFACTNNIVEYKACIAGIYAALDMNVRDLEIYGDSALIICQTNGNWQTKDPKLNPYHQYLETLVKKFIFISLNHMPRAKNQFANALATLASMIQIFNNDVIKPLIIEICQEPAHCMEIKVDDKPWFHDIKQFLQNGEFPLQASEVNKKTIRKLAASYFLSGNTLYKRSTDMTFINVIRAINPKASNGHQVILVTIDYFTKWVEATSYGSVTKKEVTRFIKREIICRYGQPEAIVTNNASNLNNYMMTTLCKQFKIKHLNYSPYQPNMNGVVEAANKNIKKILAKMIVTYKDWHEILPYALHAYRTSVRTSTEATHYSLVYGMEAVLPIELEIPSMRILSESGIDEEDLIQKRIDYLNLLDEKRLAALCHGQCYQRRMVAAYNKKVKPRHLLLPPHLDLLPFLPELPPLLLRPALLSTLPNQRPCSASLPPTRCIRSPHLYAQIPSLALQQIPSPSAPRSPHVCATHCRQSCPFARQHHRQSYTLCTEPVPFSSAPHYRQSCPLQIVPYPSCTEPMSLLLHRACLPALCAPIPRLCTPAHYSHAPASPTEKNSNTRQNWHH